MAKEVNSNIWKLISVSNQDGAVVTVKGCGVGVGSMILTTVQRGESVHSDLVYVADLRLKEIVEYEEKNGIQVEKARYWGFNTGNIK